MGDDRHEIRVNTSRRCQVVSKTIRLAGSNTVLSIVLSICRCTLPLNSYTHTDWLLPTTKWVVAISEAITALLMRLGVPIAQKRRHVADEVCNPFQGIVPRPQRPGNVLRTLLLGPDPKHDNGLNF